MWMRMSMRMFHGDIGKENHVNKGAVVDVGVDVDVDVDPDKDTDVDEKKTSCRDKR